MMPDDNLTLYFKDEDGDLLEAHDNGAGEVYIGIHMTSTGPQDESSCVSLSRAEARRLAGWLLELTKGSE
jgi:hypothetical protein